MASPLPVSFRINPEDLAVIDREAHAHRLSRSEYVIRKLLDRLGAVGLDHRVDELEQRIQRLETAAYGGY